MLTSELSPNQFTHMISCPHSKGVAFEGAMFQVDTSEAMNETIEEICDIYGIPALQSTRR